MGKQRKESVASEDQEIEAKAIDENRYESDLVKLKKEN